MPSLLAIGLGYTTLPLALDRAAAGWTVTGTGRDPVRAVPSGIGYVSWAAPARLPADLVHAADVIVISVPPTPDGCPVANAMPMGALRPDQCVLYLSSSGVYGDHGGAWIDETTPCAPATDRGQARRHAEATWERLAVTAGARLHLCRIAGIYGPGRNALDSLGGQGRGAAAGLAQRVFKPEQVFNRIHRDDIVAGLRALIDAPAAPMIVNFADDLPAPPQDVIAYAAELLGLPVPPLVPLADAQLSPIARSFYADNKRLRNARLKALPGFRLTYPDYRVGLRALLAASQ